MWTESTCPAPPGASAAVRFQLSFDSTVYKVPLMRLLGQADEGQMESTHKRGQVSPVGHSNAIWDEHREAERRVRTCASINVTGLALR